VPAVEKNDVQSRFGLAVRLWRARRGISQEKLAERAGLHRTYISDVERGSRNVSLSCIDRLAAALDLSFADLFATMETPPGGALVAGPPERDRLLDILFVEDRAEDAELTIHALSRARIANRIHWVQDGESALAYLFGKPGALTSRHGRPELVLLDLGLPRMSGQEVLRRIKSDPSTREIPVVVLTASTHDRDAVSSRQLGADAYIVKPVDFQNLSLVAPQLKLCWGLLNDVVEVTSVPSP